MIWGLAQSPCRSISALRASRGCSGHIVGGGIGGNAARFLEFVPLRIFSSYILYHMFCYSLLPNWNLDKNGSKMVLKPILGYFLRKRKTRVFSYFIGLRELFFTTLFIFFTTATWFFIFELLVALSAFWGYFWASESTLQHLGALAEVI